ncbi:MAG: hypothetical protein AB7G68_11565 [Nitrospiraceae bacterium]
MNTTTNDLAWWYWMLTVGLLGVGVTGWPWGVPLAMGLCAIQILHFRTRTGSLTSFPVQVRMTYMLLLALGLWPPLQWIHFVQVIGTSARVLVGYCLLARALSLAPWNRVEPLSAALVRNTFLSMQPAIAPCGSVLRRPTFEG